MKSLTTIDKIKQILESKKGGLKARLFATREDGITIYDSVQNQTTASVSALVSGVWQASEALMILAQPTDDVMEFRLAFDTSSQGMFLFPFTYQDKRYFLGAIYQDCLNPGQLKRQVALIKEELDRFFLEEPQTTKTKSISNERQGFLFKDISDAEIDRLFSLGGL